MKLHFKVVTHIGTRRYYPVMLAAKVLVDLTGRKCLNESEIEALKAAGFEIAIMWDTSDESGAV